MITTCTTCGKGYEAGSEEQANEPVRFCPTCWTIDRARRPRDSRSLANDAPDDGTSTIPSSVREMLLTAHLTAELLHEFTRDVQAGTQPGFHPRARAALQRTREHLEEVKTQVCAAIATLERAGVSRLVKASVSDGVAEATIAITGADPSITVEQEDQARRAFNATLTALQHKPIPGVFIDTVG